MNDPIRVRDAAAAVIERIWADSGRPARSIGDDDALIDALGLDSLDLAVLVVGLQQELGVDPFRAGAAPVRTFGELVLLYEEHLEGRA